MAAVPIFYFMKILIDQIKWGIGPG